MVEDVTSFFFFYIHMTGIKFKICSIWTLIDIHICVRCFSFNVFSGLHSISNYLQGMKGPPGMDGEKGVPGIAGPRVCTIAVLDI